MKHFFRTLLCFVLLLAMLPCSVQGFAAGDAAIVCESVVGSAGDRVTVAVSIENNPGFSYLELTPTYDEQLILVEATNASLISDFTEGKQYVWSADEDVTVNGLLLTMTFEIPENTPVGSYSFGFILRTCGNNSEQSVPFTVKGGTVTVAEATSSITDASFELSSSINANLYAELANSHTAAKMRFTMYGKETLVEGVATDRDGIWKFQFQGISPQCMGDTFKAELVLGDEVLDVVEEFSVRAYCDMLFSSSAGALGISSAKFRAAKKMMADLLEYGAMAQQYRNYKTDSLVNEGITGKSTFTELEAAIWDKELGATSTPGTELTGANVWFDNEIQLCFKFTAPGCTDTNFSVKVTDSDTGVTNEYTLSDFEVLSAEDNLYCVLSEPVPVAHFGHYFTITLNSVTVDRRGNRIVTPIQTLDYYGVNAYIFAKQNDRGASGELTPMANLARAAYCYGDSAATYDSI